MPFRLLTGQAVTELELIDPQGIHPLGIDFAVLADDGLVSRLTHFVVKFSDNTIQKQLKDKGEKDEKKTVFCICSWPCRLGKL